MYRSLLTHVPLTLTHYLYTHLGATDDLEKVTAMARRQVTEFGMSAAVGHVSLRVSQSRRQYSQKLYKLIDEVGKILTHVKNIHFLNSLH